MPAYGKEHQKEHMAKIRRILVLNPDASIPQVCEKVKLQKDYVRRLINKIRGERTTRFERYTINTALAGFADLMDALDNKLWKVILDEDTPGKVMVSALKEIRLNNVALFDKMFDAGIFEKKLGKLNIDNKISDDRLAELTNAYRLAFFNKPKIIQPKEPDKK